MSVRGRALLLARQHLDAYFLRSQDREVTLTGDTGGSRAADTPVTSPEGSDKGGKLPRQLQLSPASDIFMLSCRMLDTETNFAAPRFIGGLPPMPAPFSRDPA